MCECRPELEAKLLARFIANEPTAKNHSVRLVGYGFTLTDNKMQVRGCMPIEADAEYPLKKGGHKSKTQRSSMFFSYCPFCGEKWAA